MPRSQYPRRVRPRLTAELYADPTAICSLTICTLNRAPLFADHGLAGICRDVLAERAGECRVALLAYCIMPDHVHILASPTATSLIEFVRQVKSVSTRALWHKGVAGRIWQARFYDHFLRRDEDVETVRRYILANPMRKGLVATADEYPFSGAMQGV
jgi:putative transposase